MTTAALTEMAKHTVDHKLTLTADLRRLRCHTCDVWVSLPSEVPATSNVQPLNPPRDQQCPAHRGEWAHACRPCTAETLEGSQPAPWRPPSAAPTQEYLTARAQLLADRAARGEAPDATYEQAIQAMGGRLSEETEGAEVAS